MISPALAQAVAPEFLAAHHLGGIAHTLAQASPCFPRQGRDAELQRMAAAAQARIADDPDQMQAFQRGYLLASQQQRYIARSDPVACAQAAAFLQHFLSR